jgi:hypothetical protein
MSSETSGSALLGKGLSELISAATTVCATSMIVLKIILVTRKSRAHYSYTKIIEILVQSAALESVVMMVNCFADIGQYAFSAFNHNNGSFLLLQLSTYASAFRFFVIVRVYLFPELAAVTDRPTQGVAPTLIAFRVAEETPRTEVNSTNKSSPLSRLAFRRSAHHTDKESGVQHTWISTIRFGSTHRDDPVISRHSRVGVDEGLVPLGCRPSV